MNLTVRNYLRIKQFCKKHHRFEAQRMQKMSGKKSNIKILALLQFLEELHLSTFKANCISYDIYKIQNCKLRNGPHGLTFAHITPGNLLPELQASEPHA